VVRLHFFNVNVTTPSHPLEQFGSIPCLDTRFVAYLDVLAEVIGKSLRVYSSIAYLKTLT